ncbi:MAG TPA: efflux RND transporter permease subunit, partial [Chloroflexota bacterium]
MTDGQRPSPPPPDGANAQQNGHARAHGLDGYQSNNDTSRRSREPAAPRIWLSDLSIRQPHFITMVMVAVTVVGALLYSRMGLDLFPDVSFPIVAVQVPYPGAGPSEVERSVTRPIEDAVISLSGVDSVRSTSMDGAALVIVQFQLDRDAKEAADEVQARVTAIRNTLPLDVREPTISKFDPAAAPIVSFAVSDNTGKRSAEQLRALLDDTLKARLERVPGVAAVSIQGGLLREIHVDLKRDRLEALRVAPAQVTQALVGENQDVPGGTVADGTREQSLRTIGQFRSIGDIADMPVSTAAGATVQLKDLADVSDARAEVRTLRRLNGADAVVASLQKQSGTNTVAVADAAKHEVDRIRADYPDLGISTTGDQSDFTREAVDDVQVSMLLGALLAALVVFAFFRDWRNTLVTVIGLPVIVLGTFAVMSVFGMGLNMITLMALSLSIGMLIDDAIVVRENIFRHMEAGEHPKVAAQRGTAEIALAVIAVSSTIVAVFLPIAFTSGIVGMFLRDFGLTIAIAVLLSLVEAFTLAPMLSAYFFKPMTPHAPGDRRASQVERAFGALEQAYRRLLAWSLGHRWAVMAVGVGAFIGSLLLLPLMGFAFQPATDQGAFGVSLELPAGSRLEDTDRVARRMEASLREYPAVKDVFTHVGSDDGAVEKATISVLLTSKGHGITSRTIAAVRPSVEAAARGAKLSIVPSSTSSTIGGNSAVISALTSRPIQFTVQGANAQDLDTASAQVVAALRQVPGAVDVDRSLQPGRPGLQIVPDRNRAADLGVSSSQLGATVRTLVNGQRAGTFTSGDKDIDVVVRLRADDRGAESVARLPIASSKG